MSANLSWCVVPVAIAGACGESNEDTGFRALTSTESFGEWHVEAGPVLQRSARGGGGIR